jgi:hypothetical protein
VGADFHKPQVKPRPCNLPEQPERQKRNAGGVKTCMKDNPLKVFKMNTVNTFALTSIEERAIYLPAFSIETRVKYGKVFAMLNERIKIFLFISSKNASTTG